MDLTLAHYLTEGSDRMEVEMVLMLGMMLMMSSMMLVMMMMMMATISPSVR